MKRTPKRHNVTSLILVIAVLLLPTQLLANVLTVPDSYTQISTAIASASAATNDTILVSNKGETNDPYAYITMKKDVPVIAAANSAPKIQAKTSAGSGTTFAVKFPTDATSSTELRGFKILASSSTDTLVIAHGGAELHQCTLDGNGYAVSVGLFQSGEARSPSSSFSDSLTILMNNTTTVQYGVFLTNSDFTLHESRIEVDGATGSKGIVCDSQIGLVGPAISGCTVISSGEGIDLSAVTTFISGVGSCTVHNGSGFGIIGGSTTSGGVQINNCIAYGDSDGTSEISGKVSYVHDCIAWPDGFAETGHLSGKGNAVNDPLFCDPDNGVLTLRIDSYANPEQQS